MTINYNLAPQFQWYFPDTVGDPAINGTMATFKASAHTTPKAVYEDKAGTIPFPNPITLNAAGVVADATGDPKPIYWADDEDYYVEVRDSSGTLIQSVDDYNAAVNDIPTPTFDEVDMTNFMLNAQYRFPIETTFEDADLPDNTDVAIAEEGWFFFRDTANSTNEITFETFAAGQTDVPENPLNFLRFSSSVTGVETRKDICFTIEDVNAFSGEDIVFAFYGRSSVTSTIQVVIRQEFGSGGSSTVETILDNFNLTSDFVQYEDALTVPSVSGKSVESGNRLLICFRMPLSEISEIDLVNIQLNKGQDLLEFSYLTNELEYINKTAYKLPAVGSDDRYKSISLDDDGRTEIWASNPPIGFFGWHCSDIEPNGWLECDGRTLEGEEQPYARLYDVIGSRYGVGDDGFFCFAEAGNLPIFVNNFDTNVTDIADGTTGFAFSTEIQGGDKGFSVVIRNGSFTVTNKSNGIVTPAASHTSGFTVNIDQVGTGVLPEITTITPISAAPLSGKYFVISSTSTDYYVWFTVNGGGSDPAIGGRTGIKIALLSTLNIQGVATENYYALNGCEHSNIVTLAAASLSAGDYFTIDNSTTTYVIWYRIDGIGTEPVVSGTKISVPISTGFTAAQVANATKADLLRILFKIPAVQGYFVRARDNGAGIDPLSGLRLPAGDVSIVGDQIGTYQEDGVGKHTHEIQYYANAGTERGGSSVDTTDTTFLAPTEENSGAETRPKNIYFMPIIKY